jgi:Protein of unknown function (DUF2950)
METAMTEDLQGRRLRKLVVMGISALAAAALGVATSSQAFAQQKYPTVEAAVDALVASAKSGDEKAALVVLGAGGEDVISSGDKVSDDAVRARFLSSYDAKHEIKTAGEGATLIIGENDYPFPIPLVRRAGKWSFDTDAGRIEILARRIGHNELDAIQTALAYADAQDDYAAKDRGMGAGVYAQHFISTPGKKDGLYWQTAPGEEESPLGELFADASAEGYGGGGGHAPYHGYYFKILTNQGPSAAGGAVDYVVNGKMIGGYGLVAYPAEYRNSGVMTFIVNYSGTIYQKDLGPNTEQLAEKITSFNPDPTWKKVESTEVVK